MSLFELLAMFSAWELEAWKGEELSYSQVQSYYLVDEEVLVLLFLFIFFEMERELRS